MRIATLFISTCLLLVAVFGSGESQFLTEPGRGVPIPVPRTLHGSVKTTEGNEKSEESSSTITKTELLSVSKKSSSLVEEDTESASTPSPWKPESLGTVACQLKHGKYTYFKINFQASFNITYETSTTTSLGEAEVMDLEGENSTYAYAAVNMPTIKSCEGERNDDCTQINATFSWDVDSSAKGNNWTLQLVYEVEKAPKKGHLCELKDQDDWDSFEYWLKGMKLEYETEGNLFPHAADSDQLSAENDTMNLFEVDSDSSYKCDSNSSAVINSFVTIYFKDFQSQAFQFEESKGDTAFDTAKLCSADDDGSSLVPIIVGCVLAGLIILTLVAYFIGRWHQNRQESYQAL